MKKTLKVTILVALITLAAISLTPTTIGRKVKPIKIGVIAATQAGYEEFQPLFKEILEPDINNYVSKLPRFRFTPAMEFEFLVEHADASPDIHLEKVQMFHEMGVDLIIGGFWSSQAAASLDYVNLHDMLLLSPSSTSPALNISDDNLFRLCPDDNIQGKPLAKMMYSKGVRNAIVLARDDGWGQSLSPVFQSHFVALGGNVLDTLYYPTDNLEELEFTQYLAQAEVLAASSTDVSVLLVSFEEVSDIIHQAYDYPTIYNPPWFTVEVGGRSDTILEEAPDDAVHLKLYSPRPIPPDTSKYRDFAERYKDLTYKDPRYYTATAADAAWVLAQAVLETRPSAAPRRYDEAQSVIDVLPDVTSRHYGYSGWTLLNKAGDRIDTVFDIWGYYLDDVTPSYKTYGTYDTATDELNWYP